MNIVVMKPDDEFKSPYENVMDEVDEKVAKGRYEGGCRVGREMITTMGCVMNS